MKINSRGAKLTGQMMKIINQFDGNTLVVAAARRGQWGVGLDTVMYGVPYGTV